MEKMIAYCGLVCSDCEAFKATQAKDEAALEAVAAKWREQFDPSITADSIRCDGCLATDGPLCSYCAVCPLRVCGMEKGVENCAMCADFEGCEKLEAYFEHAPHMREVLTQMRQQSAA